MSLSYDKTAILSMKRPSFQGNAAKMSCPSKQSRNHLLSWESIRNGYYAALNPSSKSSCDVNLWLLYNSVGLTPDKTAISNACQSSNVSNNSVTSADSAVLDVLNSSMANLRCSHASSNQSVGGAMDIPCANQTYQNSQIEISGVAADRISYFLEIGTTDPQPFYIYKTNQLCGGSGSCSKTRTQTSDCINDVGSGMMPSSSAKVVYLNGYTGKWTGL